MKFKTTFLNDTELSTRRCFTPDVLSKARVLMNEALRACRTAAEYRRVVMADESLRQFERFMKKENDLSAGRFENLADDFACWWNICNELIERYQENHAFYERWRYRRDGVELPHGQIFREATRRNNTFMLLTVPPLTDWRYQADPDDVAEKESWLKPDYDRSG